jgi:hypothetical protein
MKVFLPLFILLALMAQVRHASAQSTRTGGGQGPPRPQAVAAATAAQAKQDEEIKKILNDPTIWGKDFPQLLKTLPLFAGGGEKTVLIFPESVVGGTPYPNLPQSLKAIEGANAANRMVNDTKQGEAFKRAMGARSGEVLTLFHANPFEEDDSQRVTLDRPGREYLPPDKSIAAIRKSRGEPQKITKVRINGASEDRPEVLTYYEYAGGAVTFVMHNYRRYGYVDRVILNLPAIQSALASKPNP